MSCKFSAVAACAAFGALGAISAAAACHAESGDARTHLIELYTSEGCSSCPPAEQWLRSLRGKTDLVALEYHVDYWDTRDFHDPYADARHSVRQRAFARAHNVNVVTPQVVLDGQAWKNWPKGTPPEPLQVRAAPLALDATIDATTLRVRATITGAGHERVVLALTQDGLSNQVNAGENRGKRLVHDDVVRAFAGPFAATPFEAELPLPTDAQASSLRLVAFVQDARDDRVLDVVPLPLDGCVARAHEK